MKILFIHQNFPGQFLHLAPELARRGHDCLALTDIANNRSAGIPFVKYRYTPPTVDPKQTRVGRNYTTMSDRGVAVARAAQTMRDEKGYVPDLILGHSGWGETLFLKEVWPEARLVVYSEFYYRGHGRDMGFDPEFTKVTLDNSIIAQGRATHLGQALVHADAGIAPTEWQASTFPAPLRQMLTVLHDGIDTGVARPDQQARLELTNGQVLTAQDEVVSFVNRNLEPYRGWHVFLRALPEVLRARPEAQVVIVGGDGISYGQPPTDGRSWKDAMLEEVGPQLDLSRVHFLGRVPHPTFIKLMQITRVHAYLTYPFVLSWSMLEAMAAGVLVVGSRTPPVEEVIEDGVNGVLVDFFDIPGWSATLIEALEHPERFLPLRQTARQTIIDRYDLATRCLPRLVDYIEAQGSR